MTLRIAYFILFLLLASQTACAHTAKETKLQCLRKNYPAFTIASDNNTIYFQDNHSAKWDDGASKDLENDFDHILENTSNISQMFLIPYPSGQYPQFKIPQTNEDPGRIRLDLFFLKIYGDNPEKIKSDLVPVKWIDDTTILFNKNFGAANALQNVSNELKNLIIKKPYLKEHLISPIGGTFEWRPIAGTNRFSVHSFGVAIDINTKKSDYWYWDKKNSYNYKNRIPTEIPEVFEKFGFIWGGKWYHYDTMHFEYRPELFNCR